MVKLIESYISESKTQESIVKNQLIRLLTHMLKCKYQNNYPNKGSWRYSITDALTKILSEFKNINQGALYNNFYIRKLDLDKYYKVAIAKTAIETGLSKDIFPNNCEWTKQQLVDSDYIYDFIQQYGQDVK